MMAVWVALAGCAGVIITAVVSWTTARRTTSGRVTTTEAGTLWDAAETIRKELRDEVATLRARVETCDAELTKARMELHQAKVEIDRLERLLGRPRKTS